MRVTILSFGTRGDVQPFIALGLGLKRAGYTVTIAAANEFKDFVESYGLIYSSLNYDIKKDVERSINDRFDTKRKNPIAIYRQQKLEWPEMITDWMDKSYAACEDCELLVFSGLAMMYGFHIAEKLGVPAVPVYLQPVTLTSVMPFMLFPDLNLGGWYNRLTYRMYSKSEWHMIGKAVNQWRRRNCLKELKEKDSFIKKHMPQTSVVCGFSSYVFPKPHDWGRHVSVAGYFFLDEEKDWEPSPELSEFLESGPAPVYIGFGSSSFKNNDETTGIILEALKRTKQRAILSVGWGGIKETELPDNMIIIDNVPHHWLFPRMKALVHHGGAGTTAEGLRAGVPSVIIPVGIDAPFWGNRLHSIGIGPKPIHFNNLSVSVLEAAINEVAHDTIMKEKISIIGEKIKNEDGVSNAIDVIKQV